MDSKPRLAPERRKRPAARQHLTGVGKVAAAFVATAGTIIATLFLLVDHGLFRDHAEQAAEPAKILNVAVRELRAPLLGGSDAAGESQLGNLVADAYREAGAAQLSFVNSRGLRANIQAGQVTRSELAGVLPFNNTLVKMELTGAQVWALLGQQFANDQILQVSGLRFTYQITPEGTGRIRNVEHVSVGGGAVPVTNDNSKRYSVAVDSFLANGGDGFSILMRGTHRVATTVGAVDALAGYISTLSRPFDSGIQARIVRLT